MKFAVAAWDHVNGGGIVSADTLVYGVVDFSGCQVPKAFVTVNADGLVDDGDRSKQNEVKILNSNSNNGHPDVVETMKE